MSNVKLVYFSPTGNTKKSVESMAQALSQECDSFDLTEPALLNGFENIRFKKDDFVIFGAPVYCGRIPEVAVQRFSHFCGDNTPCVVVVTFGNRDFDDSLLEFYDMAKSQGFVVLGAAALVGRHTYGEIQIQRPDLDDFETDKNFIQQVVSKNLELKEKEISGQRPYRGVGKGGHFHPLTDENCTNCGLCVRKCPVGAIDEDCRTISDDCLSCFRCIRICPKKAKNMNIESYNAFAAEFTEKLKTRKENRYFL